MHSRHFYFGFTLIIFRLAVIGQKFENIADQTEPWYDTKYKMEKIPEDILEVKHFYNLLYFFPGGMVIFVFVLFQSWENSGFCKDLALPKPNDFITNNFEIYPREEVIFQFFNVQVK